MTSGFPDTDCILTRCNFQYTDLLRWRLDYPNFILARLRTINSLPHQLLPLGSTVSFLQLAPLLSRSSNAKSDTSWSHVSVSCASPLRDRPLNLTQEYRFVLGVLLTFKSPKSLYIYITWFNFTVSAVRPRSWLRARHEESIELQEVSASVCSDNVILLACNTRVGNQTELCVRQEYFSAAV